MRAERQNVCGFAKVLGQAMKKEMTKNPSSAKDVPVYRGRPQQSSYWER